MTEPDERYPASIDGKPYPIAVDEGGDILWRTEQVAEERDEVWEDLSLGMGETVKETGRGYYFSKGWDASLRSVLKLSPHFIADNNTALTTGTGYFLEEEGAGTTLDEDTTDPAGSTTTAAITSVAEGGSGLATLSHTVGTNDDRMLLVTVTLDDSAGDNDLASVKYGGESMDFLASKADSNVAADITIKEAVFYLLQPVTGTNDVVVTFNINVNTAVSAVSFENVNQDTPFGTVVTTTGTGTSPSVTVVSASGELVYGCVGTESLVSGTAGASETEEWDANGNSVSTHGYKQVGAASVVINPTLSGSATFAIIGVPIKAANSLFTFLGDATKIYKYQFDGSALTLIATTTVSSGEAGRSAKFLGVHYMGMGNGADSVRLTDVGVPTWTDSNFKADHLVSYQKGVDPTMVKSGFDAAGTEAEGQLGSVTTAPTSESFSNFGKAGDSSTKVTDLVAAGGKLYAMKEDGIFEFGLEGESRRVAFTGEAGKVDAENGKGSFAFGDDTIVYTGDQLWRYRIGQGALPVGLDSLRGFRNVATTGLAPPIDGKPRSGVVAGEYWYVLQNEGERSLLLQMRIRREGDPSGHEMLIHGVLELPLCKGIWKDSRNNLWLKGASADESDRDVRVIKLNKDGSLEVDKRKGQANSTAVITLDERDWDRPFELKQFRAFHIETSGDWDSTTSLTTHIFRDDNAIVQIGSAITTATTTINTWTIGTSDQGYRLRPQLQLATNSSYKPLVTDAGVLRFKIVARFPEILRIVIPAEDSALAEFSLTAIDVEQNLRRLQQQGDITLRRPGDSATFVAEIESVSDTMYRTQDNALAHGLGLRVRRWITP